MRNYRFIFSSSSFSNEDFTGSYSSQIDLSTESIFTFCTFNSEGLSGGAIYFHDTTSDLFISHSLFYKCNASLEHGGALYCYNCGRVSIYSSSFVECACTNYNTAGGGLCFWGVSITSLIKHTNFVSCSTEGDGGGLDFYGTYGQTNQDNLPIQECKFVGCVAYGNVLDERVNDADGGGLIFYGNAHTLGISNSLFCKCESKLKAGGSFVTINQEYFDNIIRFCFYCENTAPEGRNALIHFNDSSTDLSSKIFFHSFTSDNTITNSLVQNYSAASAITQN